MRGKTAPILAVLLGAASGSPATEVFPVAEYWERSGTVAPPYAWNWSASIEWDGSVMVTYCRGYATEPPGCATRVGQVTPDDLARIPQTAAAAGFPAMPAEEATEIPVGGGSRGGMVQVDANGRPSDLPAFPAEADAGRVQLVLTAILSAIPADVVTAAAADAKAPAN